MTAAELSRLQVRRHFDAHAEEYDRYAIVQQHVVDRLGDLFDWQVESEGTILEVGTGTGGLAQKILQRQPGLRLVLSDLAHGMTRHAQERLAINRAVDADAGALPFTSSCFSGVTSSSVYQWVEPLPDAFREVARVLQPGGWFVFALFGENSLCELKDSHRRALVDCGKVRASHVQSFPTRAEVASALSVSGMESSQLFTEKEVEFHPDVPTLLRGLKRIGAGNASRRRPPGLASRKVVQRMIDIYSEDYGCEEGVPATYEVVYGISKRCFRSDLVCPAFYKTCRTAHLRYSVSGHDNNTGWSKA